jgi:hypothetical protein
MRYYEKITSQSLSSLPSKITLPFPTLPFLEVTTTLKPIVVSSVLKNLRKDPSSKLNRLFPTSSEKLNVNKSFVSTVPVNFTSDPFEPSFSPLLPSESLDSLFPLPSSPHLLENPSSGETPVWHLVLYGVGGGVAVFIIIGAMVYLGHQRRRSRLGTVVRRQSGDMNRSRPAQFHPADDAEVNLPGCRHYPISFTLLCIAALSQLKLAFYI